MSMIINPYAFGVAGGGLTPIIWNSADTSADITLSESDKRATRTAGSSSWRMARAPTSCTIGGGSDLLIEVEILGDNQVIVGFAAATESLSAHLGANLGGYGYYANNGNKMNNNPGAGVAYGATVAVGDKIRAKVTSAGTIEFFKNGVSQGIAFTGLVGTVYPAVSVFNSGLSSARAT